MPEDQFIESINAHPIATVLDEKLSRHFFRQVSFRPLLSWLTYFFFFFFSMSHHNIKPCYLVLGTSYPQGEKGEEEEREKLYPHAEAPSWSVQWRISLRWKGTFKFSLLCICVCGFLLFLLLPFPPSFSYDICFFFSGETAALGRALLQSSHQWGRENRAVQWLHWSHQSPSTEERCTHPYALLCSLKRPEPMVTHAKAYMEQPLHPLLSALFSNIMLINFKLLINI